MSEVNREVNNVPEQKEKPQAVVLEIGTYPGMEAFRQYKFSLPEGAKYEIIKVAYNLLPNEDDPGRPIDREDNSVDEVIISNVLCGEFYSPEMDEGPDTKDRLRAFWKFIEKRGPLGKMSLDDITDEVAVFQKFRTVKDIIRVLKPRGVLRIYENYNPVRPAVAEKVLKLVEEDLGVVFSEDMVEEKRISPILDAENLQHLEDKKKLYGKEFNPENFYPRRTHNKVYKVIKKPPQ